MIRDDPLTIASCCSFLRRENTERPRWTAESFYYSLQTLFQASRRPFRSASSLSRIDTPGPGKITINSTRWSAIRVVLRAIASRGGVNWRGTKRGTSVSVPARNLEVNTLGMHVSGGRLARSSSRPMQSRKTSSSFSPDVRAIGKYRGSKCIMHRAHYALWINMGLFYRGQFSSIYISFGNIRMLI